MAQNGGQQQQQPPMLIRPAQIDNLPYLDANVKAQYKNGLANLWTQYESNPDGSPEKQTAYEKIRTASQKLMAQLRQGNARPNSAQGQGQAQQQMTPQQAQQMRIMAQQQQQQGGGGGDQSSQMPQQGAQQQMQLTQKSQDELNSVQLNLPQNQQQAWRNTAIQTLYRRENILRTAQNLQQQMQSLQKSGQQVPEQLSQKFGEAKKAMDGANRQWLMLKAKGEGQNTQQAGPQSQQQQQRPITQQGQAAANAQQQNSSQVVPQQQQQPDSKPAEQRASVSPPQPQSGFQQNSQQQGTPAQQNQAQQNKLQAPSQPQLQQMPQTAAQPQPQQNFPQQQQQGQGQPRPQINTQMANAQMAQQQPQQQQPQQGAPNSGMPNSANQQRPQALTQQAAISQAADAYTRSQQQMAQQGQQPPQVPNGLPFSTQPSSASQQNTPTYPSLQTTQQSSNNTKFPIPKTLALDPRTQTPVQGPPSRPTMANTGMMFNPGLQRQPPFTLEGEGDRVLSKRKLDELVRQVTGSAPASTDGSNNVLAPDVEEAMLELADDFVDTLVTQACKLAKLRANQTLDIRDVQIVLERNYGIRVPGYSLEEARVVKKFVPAAGWQQKMQAVQAGKVMGNKDA